MRILPVALYLHGVFGPDFPRCPEAYDLIHRASALTHAHPISCMACGLYCAAANALLCGGEVGEGLETAKAFYRTVPELSPHLKTFVRVDAAVLRGLSRREICSSGYVVHTLEAALWCLLRAGDFRACLLEAVNLGEDTDTVGAVAGGLAGLRWGLAGIPEEWLAVLARREEIEALCSAFAKSV